MRAAVLTSTSFRHHYFKQQIKKIFDVRISLHEQKKKNAHESAINESEALRLHFATLAESEKNEFSTRIVEFDAGAIEPVENINDPVLVEQAKKSELDLILLFGTSILKNAWLDAFPNRIINLHLGLSPFYRGTATLFWPIANGELECVGSTIHLATDKVDTGAILRRIKADPIVGDTYYSLSTRLIRRSIDAMPQTAFDYISGRLLPISEAFLESRLFRRRDFNDESLMRALAFIGNGLTEEQIAAAEKSKKCACSR